jgi:hypothetical protein
MGVVVGCTPGPVITARSVDADPDLVLERVAAQLGRLDFAPVSRASGALEATTERASPEWASCPPVLVSAGDDRRVMASAERRQVRVLIATTRAAAGTEVTVSASFSASYRNRARATTFERSCRSSGKLERLLLSSANG